MQFFQKNDTPIEPSAQAARPQNTSELPLDRLAQLVLLGEEHSGRDEMNLAGNPFALLQAASKSSQKVLFRDWERTLPDGRVVKARWEVAGHPTLGLPGPAEEMMVLILMQITREAAGPDGVWPKTVHFSRYALLERMGWTDAPRYYTTLADGFQRLTSVTINTRYGFFDAVTKLPIQHTNFHILESSDLVDEPKGRKGEAQLPLSWFSWSDRMHESFLAGNVRSLALEFVLRVELPLSRRLFRFLDAMRWATKPARREFSIGLMNLRDRLGMTPYAYASKVKEKLAGAHEELKSCGYLDDIEFRKGAAGDVLVCYRFGEPAKTACKAPASVLVDNEVGKELETPSASNLGLSPVASLVAWDFEEEETRGLACDEVFNALEQAERDAIDKHLWEQMPPFLRSNRSTEGARNTLRRERRQRVLADYGDRVRAILEDAARAEVGVAAEHGTSTQSDEATEQQWDK